MLDHVYIVDCPRITDLALKALAASKHLNVVNVADCVRYEKPKIADNLRRVVRKNPNVCNKIQYKLY